MKILSLGAGIKEVYAVESDEKHTDFLNIRLRILSSGRVEAEVTTYDQAGNETGVLIAPSYKVQIYTPLGGFISITSAIYPYNRKKLMEKGLLQTDNEKQVGAIFMSETRELDGSEEAKPDPKVQAIALLEAVLHPIEHSRYIHRDLCVRQLRKAIELLKEGEDEASG